MTKSIGCAVVCLLGLAGCTVERYDDCDDDFHYRDDDDDRPSKPSAGSDSGGRASQSEGGTAGGGKGGSAGSAAGGTSSGGTGPAPNPSCEEERDCEPGYNCDLEQHECVATDAETCPELKTEAACENRRDCVPIYGGINCSCGQDCECKGGEPGCICESFEFFACEAAP